MKSKVLVLGLVLLLLSGSLLAQSDRASITGTVKDPSGAVVPGVQITATNTETKVQTTGTTNGLGLYNILNLPIGRYSVSFSKDGFQTLERKGLILGINQVADVDAVLAVGASKETLVVTEDAPMLQTQTASVGVDLKQQVIMDLPLTASGGRILEDFAYKTMPGVEGNNWQEHIAGSTAQSKEILIDGTSAVQQIGGHLTESSPSMEAVEEFQVSTSGMRAEDGKSGGGVFRFNLKSGTNKWHGSGFGFLQNEMLNANGWDRNFWKAYYEDTDPAKATEWKRGKSRFFDYGGSFGGPIQKDKTFFFTAYERYTQNKFQLGGMGNTVPIPAFLNGDFSAILGGALKDGSGNDIINQCTGTPFLKGQIFDWTTRRTVNGQNCATPFAGNIIPADRISGVSKQIADIYREYYAPESPNLTGNSARPANIDPWFHQTQLSFKVDHNFSERNRLSGSYIYVRRPRVLVEGGVWAAGTKDGGPFSQSRNHFVHSDAIRLSDTHTFSNNVINVVSFTYNRFNNPQIDYAAAGDWGAKLGLYEGAGGNFPVVNFNGDHDGNWMTGIGHDFNNQYTANTFYWNDNLSWVKGRHTMKFGADVRFYQMNSQGNHGVATFNFDANTTGIPTAIPDVANHVGFAFASMLLGQVDSASMTVPNNLYGRRKTLSVYAQDDYKVTDKLTLNVDLRWDFNGRYHEKEGRWSNYNVDEINPVTGIKGVLEFAKDGSDSFERNQFYGNFAPRVGAAYQLTPKTVVRGSYEMFYAPLNLQYWAGVPYGFNPGFVGDNRVVRHDDWTPAFRWDSGYTGVEVPATKDPNFVKWGMVSVDPNSLKPGRVNQWNIEVQRELTKDMRLDVRYMANRGDHLQSGFLRANQPTDIQGYGNLIRSGKQWNWITNAGEAAAAGVPYPYAGWQGLALYAMMPYPDVASTWGPLFFVGSPLGESRYKSLQMEVSKRASHGLSMDVSYTLSAAHGDVDTSWQEAWWAGPIQNVYNLKEEAKSILPYDQTHVFKGYVQYELPFGKGKAFLSEANRVLNAAVSGWTISSMFRYNSGTPLRVLSANGYPLWNNVYANVDPKIDLSSQFNPGTFNMLDKTAAGNGYFNPAAFSSPTYGDLGTAPGYLSQLRGFGYKGEDIGIMKYFGFGADGQYRLQFRFELYNAFNRHYFNNPNTNLSDTAHFGKVDGAYGGRTGQFGARFSW